MASQRKVRCSLSESYLRSSSKEVVSWVMGRFRKQRFHVAARGVRWMDGFDRLDSIDIICDLIFLEENEDDDDNATYVRSSM